MAATLFATDTVTRTRAGADDLVDLPVQVVWPANPFQPVVAFGQKVDCVLRVAATADGPDIQTGDTITRTAALNIGTLRGQNTFQVIGMQERGGSIAILVFYLAGA